jgi:hypothetical protein
MIQHLGFDSQRLEFLFSRSFILFYFCLELLAFIINRNQQLLEHGLIVRAHTSAKRKTER